MKPKVCLTNDISDNLYLKKTVPVNKNSTINSINDYYLNESSDLVCLANFNGYFTYINPAFVTLLGYSKKQLLTQPFSDFIHPEDIERSWGEIELLKKTGRKSIKFENRYFTSEGKIVYLEWMGTIDFKSNVIFAIGRDITDKKEIEQQLLMKERLLIEAQSISKTGSWSFDFEQNKLYWSAEMYKIFEIDNEIIGYELHQKYIQTLSDEERKSWVNLVIKSINKFQSFSFERKLSLPSGEHRWIKETGIPVKDSSNRVHKIEGIVQDITEQKEAQFTIIQNISEKELLIKELHHRVKNNMQVISSMLNLQANLVNHDELKEVLYECQQRIKSMASVHDLLYKSNNLSEINFSSYIQNLLSDVVQSYKYPNQNIEIEMSINDVNYSLDKAVPLGLLVNEIVTNSVKHGFKERENGKISFKLACHKNGKNNIEISDDGQGIKKTQNNENKTMGMLLIENLLEQLDGSVKQTVNENGTSYKISF
jgi:PAS domain S-box-containing protein